MYHMMEHSAYIAAALAVGVTAVPWQCIWGIKSVVSRDHFMYAPSQWGTTLHCNVVSHWRGACTGWSLSIQQNVSHSVQVSMCYPFLEYSGRIGPTPSVLMPWFLVLPGHQESWQWLCETHRFLFYLKYVSLQLPVLRNYRKCKYIL